MDNVPPLPPDGHLFHIVVVADVDVDVVDLELVV
jgi:hypothetical protein